jgi:hypothetical protein
MIHLNRRLRLWTLRFLVEFTSYPISIYFKESNCLMIARKTLRFAGTIFELLQRQP